MDNRTIIYVIITFTFFTILFYLVKNPSNLNTDSLETKVKVLEDQTVYLTEKNKELLILVNELSENQKITMKSHINLQQKFLLYLEE